MENIPNEIILEIFQHLNYLDLKLRVSLVCRRFHRLLQRDGSISSAILDEILFRDAPVRRHDEQLESHEFKFHPIFSGISLPIPDEKASDQSSLSYRLLSPRAPFDRRGSEGIPAVFFENAVSPAVPSAKVLTSRSIFKYFNNPVVEGSRRLENLQGFDAQLYFPQTLTVADVLERALENYRPKLKKSDASLKMQGTKVESWVDVDYIALWIKVKSSS